MRFNDLVGGKCQGNSEDLLLALLFQEAGAVYNVFCFLMGYFQNSEETNWSMRLIFG